MLETLANIVNAPRDPTLPAPSSQTIRGVAKLIIKEMLKELQRRSSLTTPHGFPEITSGEERAARFAVRAYEVAVDEAALENAPPPINLSEVSPEVLRALLVQRSS